MPNQILTVAKNLYKEQNNMQIIIISFWKESLLWANTPPEIYIHHFIGWNSAFILRYHLMPI